jgi:hypothetical protein
LLLGTYRDTKGFSIDNAEVDARCFVNGNELAVVATQSHLSMAKATLVVPGYTFKEASGVGDTTVESDGGKQTISLPKHGLAVVVFTKK